MNSEECFLKYIKEDCVHKPGAIIPVCYLYVYYIEYECKKMPTTQSLTFNAFQRLMMKHVLNDNVKEKIDSGRSVYIGIFHEKYLLQEGAKKSEMPDSKRAPSNNDVGARAMPSDKEGRVKRGEAEDARLVLFKKTLAERLFINAKEMEIISGYGFLKIHETNGERDIDASEAATRDACARYKAGRWQSFERFDIYFREKIADTHTTLLKGNIRADRISHYEGRLDEFQRRQEANLLRYNNAIEFLPKQTPSSTTLSLRNLPTLTNVSSSVSDQTPIVSEKFRHLNDLCSPPIYTGDNELERNTHVLLNDFKVFCEQYEAAVGTFTSKHSNHTDYCNTLNIRLDRLFASMITVAKYLETHDSDRYL